MIFIKRNRSKKKKRTQNLCHCYLSNLLCNALFCTLRISTSDNETEMLSLSQIAWASFWSTFRVNYYFKIPLRLNRFKERKKSKAKTTTKILLKQKRKTLKNQMLLQCGFFFFLPLYWNEATKVAEVFQCPSARHLHQLHIVRWSGSKPNLFFIRNTTIHIFVRDATKTKYHHTYSAVSGYSESISLSVFQKKKPVFIPMKNTGWLLSKCNIQKKNKAMALKQKKMVWGKSVKNH